jgi:AraC-like DNA-binding protein
MTQNNRRSTSGDPTIPAAHLQQVTDLGLSRGLTEKDLLAGTYIQPALLLDGNARIAAKKAVLLGLNLVRLSNDPGIGFELGLHLDLITQGPSGNILQAANTLRDAVDMATQYTRSRDAIIDFELKQRNSGTTSLTIKERFPLGPYRNLIHEGVVTLLWRHACIITQQDKLDCEFCFAWPQPPYFAPYRNRLPKAHWAQAVTQLRFPSRHLDLPLTLTAPVGSNLLISEVEREIIDLGNSPEHIVARVRTELRPGINGFPGLTEVAQRLLISERSLKRKLRAAETSFRELLIEAMQTEAKRLMLDPDLDLQQISARLGYQDPATFTHAFRRWTGLAPSRYRARLRQSTT